MRRILIICEDGPRGGRSTDDFSETIVKLFPIDEAILIEFWDMKQTSDRGNTLIVGKLLDTRLPVWSLRKTVLAAALALVKEGVDPD